MTTEEAEAALQAWGTVQRDELVRAAFDAGVTKTRINKLTGISRVTIDRILEAPGGMPRELITRYLEEFTKEWPKYGRALPGQRIMASAYKPAEVADALLADARFRALKLGTWLSIPPADVLQAAVEALSPLPFKQDIGLLDEALQLAVQRQQEEARQKLAVGLLGGAALAILLGGSRGAGVLKFLSRLIHARSNTNPVLPRATASPAVTFRYQNAF